MFSHVAIGSNDIERSKQFYDATLGVLGADPAPVDSRGRITYRHDGCLLIVTRPINGEPATYANGGTIGFTVASPAQADAWHAAGVGNGGTTCENPPGVREMGGRKLYLAYLRDPDGNKLCAIHRLD